MGVEITATRDQYGEGKPVVRLSEGETWEGGGGETLRVQTEQQHTATLMIVSKTSLSPNDASSWSAIWLTPRHSSWIKGHNADTYCV